MASGKSYKTRCLVLRKVKLGEKDLILTVLAESGVLLRVVAKGARKPGGSLANRLELFSVADIMCSQGRNLDVVTDAKLVASLAAPGSSLEHTACASAVAELLGTVAQEGLEQPRLFQMAVTALVTMDDLETGALIAVTAAALLKIEAMAGFRPSFDTCISCGKQVDLDAGGPVPFSVGDGGSLCGDCPRLPDAVNVDAATLSWCRWLLYARFEQIEDAELPEQLAFDILHIASMWARYHVGREIKSLDFLFTAALA